MHLFTKQERVESVQAERAKANPLTYKTHFQQCCLHGSAAGAQFYYIHANVRIDAHAVMKEAGVTISSTMHGQRQMSAHTHTRGVGREGFYGLVCVVPWGGLGAKR